jgi:hypothetical protein
VRELARSLETRAGGGAAGGGRLSVAAATAVAQPAPVSEFEDAISSGSDNDDSAPWVLRDLQQADAPSTPAFDAPHDQEAAADKTEQKELLPEQHEPEALTHIEEQNLEESLPAASAAPDSPAELTPSAPDTILALPLVPEPPALQEEAPAFAENLGLSAEPVAPAVAVEPPPATKAPPAIAAVAAAPPQGLPLSRPKPQSPAAPTVAAEPAPAKAAALEPAPAVAAVPPPATRPSRPLKPILPPLPQYTSLLTVAWVLRFLAALAAGGVLRVMDAHRQNFQSMAVTFRHLIWGLIGVTLVWAAAEMVSAVRDLLIRGARETR